MEASCQIHVLVRFIPGETTSSTQCIGDWVEFRAWSGRCEEEKNLSSLSGIKLEFFSFQPVTLILYRLTCPALAQFRGAQSSLC
jgi:hypothetical protein